MSSFIATQRPKFGQSIHAQIWSQKFYQKCYLLTPPSPFTRLSKIDFPVRRSVCACPLEPTSSSKPSLSPASTSQSLASTRR